MGATLPKGGPAGLFLGFIIYGTIILAVNQCFGESNLSKNLGSDLPIQGLGRWSEKAEANLRNVAEMVTYLPIASPFVRLSGFWVDDALSFAMGWNYFFLMGECVPLMSACSLLSGFWSYAPSVIKPEPR